MTWEEISQQTWLGHAIYSIIALILALVVNVVLIRAFDALENKLPMPRMIFMILRRILRYVILGLAVFLILERWGFELQTILAIVGTVLGMVAIGFVAVWSLLSNLMCAFVLTTFRPFRIGDTVEIMSENVEGTVVDLTLLFTTLKNKDGDYYRVPNNFFFQKAFRCRRGNQTMELGEQLMQDKPAE